MTAQLIADAISKLEEAQETLRQVWNTQAGLGWFVAQQKHYEISKAISELRYVLSTL